MGRIAGTGCTGVSMASVSVKSCVWGRTLQCGSTIKLHQLPLAHPDTVPT